MENILSLSTMDIDGLFSYSSEELDLMAQNIMNARMKKFEASMVAIYDEVKKIKNDQGLLREEIKNDLDKRDENHQRQVDVAVNSIRLNNKNKENKYERLTDLGKRYSVNISSVSIGILLRLVGIAFKNRSNTTPIMRNDDRYYIIDPATNRNGDKYTAYSWNVVNCMEKIDEWLRDNDLYEEFYSIETSNEMRDYIRTLARKFDVAIGK